MEAPDGTVLGRRREAVVVLLVGLEARDPRLDVVVDGRGGRQRACGPRRRKFLSVATSRSRLTLPSASASRVHSVIALGVGSPDITPSEKRLPRPARPGAPSPVPAASALGRGSRSRLWCRRARRTGGGSALRDLLSVREPREPNAARTVRGSLLTAGAVGRRKRQLDGLPGPRRRARRRARRLSRSCSAARAALGQLAHGHRGPARCSVGWATLRPPTSTVIALRAWRVDAQRAGRRMPTRSAAGPAARRSASRARMVRAQALELGADLRPAARDLRDHRRARARAFCPTKVASTCAMGARTGRGHSTAGRRGRRRGEGEAAQRVSGRRRASIAAACPPRSRRSPGAAGRSARAGR